MRSRPISRLPPSPTLGGRGLARTHTTSTHTTLCAYVTYRRVTRSGANPGSTGQLWIKVSAVSLSMHMHLHLHSSLRLLMLIHASPVVRCAAHTLTCTSARVAARCASAHPIHSFFMAVALLRRHIDGLMSRMHACFSAMARSASCSQAHAT
jgi:hypothetical protein